MDSESENALEKQELRDKVPQQKVPHLDMNAVIGIASTITEEESSRLDSVGISKFNEIVHEKVMTE